MIAISAKSKEEKKKKKKSIGRGRALMLVVVHLLQSAVSCRVDYNSLLSTTTRYNSVCLVITACLTNCCYESQSSSSSSLLFVVFFFFYITRWASGRARVYYFIRIIPDAPIIRLFAIPSPWWIHPPKQTNKETAWKYRHGKCGVSSSDGGHR